MSIQEIMFKQNLLKREEKKNLSIKAQVNFGKPLNFTYFYASISNSENHLT